MTHSRRWFLLVLGLCVAAGPATFSEAQDTGADSRDVLNRYCVTCHNERSRAAGLVLDGLDPGNVGPRAEIWEKVLAKLRARSMPPAGLPRPDSITYERIAGYLEAGLDRASEAKLQAPRVIAHRLNRAEYGNAVRDLLAVDVAVESLLPPDDSGYGFDNVANVLSVSPALLRRYMSAARRVTQAAIGSERQRSEIITYDLPPMFMQDQQVSDDLPLGSRGGMAIKHWFKADGEYTIRVRLQRNGRYKDEDILGLTEAHDLEIRLDDARLGQFTLGGKFATIDENYSFINGGKATSEEIAYRRTADSQLEVRIPIKAGARLIGVYFVNVNSVREGALQSNTAGFQYFNRRVEQVSPAVSSVSIEGPLRVSGTGDTPSRRRIFRCRPNGPAAEDECAREILSTLAGRAYRRPVADADIHPLMSLYHAGRENGDFESAIATGVQGLLVHPEFLFRTVQDSQSSGPYRLSDLELASRLSFFLWSSLPDEELLRVASQGRLNDPAVLDQQVKRMLADERSSSIVKNFAGQWLYLRNMRTATPDPEAFAEFDDALRADFERETSLFLEDSLRSDRSVLSLLNSDYSFVNERLAKFYGIRNVYGASFRRVKLDDENRRGLLGQGSILTVTSYANRTSPTLRGKWLLDSFLGTPPPPPPPNVPSLKERASGEKILTMRQRMEEHRQNPVCSSCHSQMDPLGFALENFNGVGKWRTEEGPTAIDATGALPDGTKFNGPKELRIILEKQPERFVSTLTKKLLVYGLGRGVEYYDLPAVRKIVRRAAPEQYRWSALFSAIAQSAPFQMSTPVADGAHDIAKETR